MLEYHYILPGSVWCLFVPFSCEVLETSLFVTLQHVLAEKSGVK